jgi:hypothetical protein
MSYMTNEEFRDTGLGDKARNVSKSVKTNLSGSFGDPFGGEDKPARMAKAAVTPKFRKGDRVRSIFDADERGEITEVGKECYVVKLSNGLSLCRFENVVQDI